MGRAKREGRRRETSREGRGEERAVVWCPLPLLETPKSPGDIHTVINTASEHCRHIPLALTYAMREPRKGTCLPLRGEGGGARAGMVGGFLRKGAPSKHTQEFSAPAGATRLLHYMCWGPELYE